MLPVDVERLMTTDHNQKSIEKTHNYSTRGRNIPNRPGAKLSQYSQLSVLCN